MTAARVIVAEITVAPVEVEPLACLVASPEAGAVATFAGVVRNHHAGRAVSYLEYEAYVPMAEHELRAVAQQACERYDVIAVAVRHRYGRLHVGDVAVAIAVSAAHRDAAFDALRFTIDSLKTRVPIWKRETGPDGSFWIEGPHPVGPNG